MLQSAGHGNDPHYSMARNQKIREEMRAERSFCAGTAKVGNYRSGAIHEPIGLKARTGVWSAANRFRRSSIAEGARKRCYITNKYLFPNHLDCEHLSSAAGDYPASPVVRAATRQTRGIEFAVRLVP